jgi:hypothetical protein
MRCLAGHIDRSGGGDVHTAMTYRDDLAALAARHTALEHEVEHKTRERDAAGRLLEEAAAKARLPVLDNIRVATPCSAEWAKMTGDDRVRHCGDCQKHVYNLSDMTRDEAEALIVEKEGRLCVRYFQRADGTILLKDCSIGVQRRRRYRRLAVAGAAMLAGAGALTYHELRDETEEQTQVYETAGGVSFDVGGGSAYETAGLPVFEPPVEPPPVARLGQMIADPPQVEPGGTEPGHAPREVKGRMIIRR